MFKILQYFIFSGKFWAGQSGLSILFCISISNAMTRLYGAYASNGCSQCSANADDLIHNLRLQVVNRCDESLMTLMYIVATAAEHHENPINFGSIEAPNHFSSIRPPSGANGPFKLKCRHLPAKRTRVSIIIIIIVWKPTAP